MKTKLLRWRRRDIARLLFASFVASPLLAATFSEWQQRQPIEVPAPGLVKIALPPATLDALRSSLEDLRLADSTGNEVPFLIERPAPEPAPVRVPNGAELEALFSWDESVTGFCGSDCDEGFPA